MTHPYPELGCLVIAHLEVRDELRKALLDELLGDVSPPNSVERVPHVQGERKECRIAVQNQADGVGRCLEPGGYPFPQLKP